MKIDLEICAYSAESCRNALRGGADRVELCASMADGGVTPAASVIEYVKEKIHIDTMVMIRPRGGDFLYSDDEFEIMKKDILICKRIGVLGVVFGILTPEGNLDKERNKILLDISKGMQTCFHRAIDMSQDYMKSAGEIVDLGFTRILTSGARNKALEGIDNLTEIVNKYGNKIEIMAGSGVNSKNIKAIYSKAKVKSFHLSAKKSRRSNMIFQNPNVSMSDGNNEKEYSIIYSDQNEISNAVKVIKTLQ